MKLLTRRFQLNLKKVLTLGQTFCWHPYVWVEHKNGPELTTSWRKFLLWRLNALLTFLYFGFIVSQCVRVGFSDETISVKLFMPFVLVFFAFPVLVQLNIMLSLEEFPQFVNGYVRYCNAFEGT